MLLGYDAISFVDAEHMRIVRNSCRDFMTRDTHEITPEEQRAWFANLDATVRPFVFDHMWYGRPGGGEWTRGVGYGLIRWEPHDDRLWLSGGLLPAWRGRGFGRHLFGHLTAWVLRYWAPATAVLLEVREDNLSAIRTYEDLGFTRVPCSETPGIFRMQHTRKLVP